MIGQAREQIIQAPSQAGGGAPRADECRFIEVLRAALGAIEDCFSWMDVPQMQGLLLDSLAGIESDEAGEGLQTVRSMTSTWLAMAYGRAPAAEDAVGCVLALCDRLDPSVPPAWLEAALDGVLDLYGGPARAEAKAIGLELAAAGQRSAGAHAQILAYDPLVESLAHRLYRLSAPQVEAVARCLSRAFTRYASVDDVAMGVAGRLFDSLLDYTGSRTRQWAAVLTGCRAGLLDARPAGKVAARGKDHPAAVDKAVNALLTRSVERHGGAVQRREATLRQCVRTGVLPDAAAPLALVLAPGQGRVAGAAKLKAAVG